MDHKRLKEKYKREKNFYERMQEDIKMRGDTNLNRNSSRLSVYGGDDAT